MYANSMLIILPNDMLCCWQERAEGEKGRKEMEIQIESKYQSCLMWKTCMCSNINTVNYFTTVFIEVDLSSVLGYEPALFH